MDEKIEVGYRNIGAALGKEYHHKFLLYTDKEGNQRTISGWTGDERPGLQYGRMHVETNLPYDRNNPDHRDNPNAIGQKQYREEIANGADLSGTLGRMVANARSKDDKYPYDPLLQNSNTLADSVLRDVGLQEPKNDGVLGHWAPASGRQLDESVQPAVPGLGNSGRAFSAGGAPLDPQQEARLRDDPLFKQALAGLDKLGPDAGVYTNQQKTRSGLPAPWLSRQNLIVRLCPRSKKSFQAKPMAMSSQLIRIQEMTWTSCAPMSTKVRPSSSRWQRTCRSWKPQTSKLYSPPHRKHHAR
ncbi:hypothetical protein XFF6992_560006 [Xanthomonas citri pv. fuscans]|nr:hypothetical protein [Xanthomonas citri]QTF19418.1 hypothetical protein XcfCFBP6992P_01740 [Xanthomonas citri pv. phaseoli var. fuscans]QTF76491.1 hypothetical protein XcfCFBP6994P_10470 [Xanthomonas citri pv. phaseoli var. fuscans]QTF76708.1 hypothetical protein XcfCFBP6996P_15270 [Xanthomonas citri pv. phaseoli var. fuscans]SOO21396.1 hypothetical protein XFF6992_560006 [Xanthomonas citri pv. fuscans]SOO35922.1 hypothetical protein XFF6994_630007 [Xanthomonas citri pv. fuscans]